MTVRAVLWGEGQARELSLAIDTGASITSVRPDVLQDLGYTAQDALEHTGVPWPTGDLPGYLVRVKRFQALGGDQSRFVVQSLPIVEEYPFDGVLGMNFLRSYRFCVHPKAQQIVLHEAR